MPEYLKQPTPAELDFDAIYKKACNRVTHSWLFQAPFSFTEKEYIVTIVQEALDKTKKAIEFEKNFVTHYTIQYNALYAHIPLTEEEQEKHPKHPIKGSRFLGNGHATFTGAEYYIQQSTRYQQDKITEEMFVREMTCFICDEVAGRLGRVSHEFKYVLEKMLKDIIVSNARLDMRINKD